MIHRLRNRPDLLHILMASLFFGAASGIFMATLNNYLAEVHGFGAEARGWLELPREFPGFLLIFVAGLLLLRLRESQMAGVAMILSAVGALGLGYLSPGRITVILWVIIWSMGDHILFAVDGPMGLKLARDGGEGRRLGQLGGARNLGTIIGVGIIFLLARFRGDDFTLFYLLSAVMALSSGYFYLKLRIGRDDPPSRKIVFRKEYRLFYAISALFGVRKQIFLAFGTWVLVSIHNVPVSTIALLYFIASTLGVVMRPLLGDVIDWLGERIVLAVDEIMLLAICLSYAFISDLLPAPYDLWWLYGAYILDLVLFGLRAARITYLKKIIRDPADITSSVSLGITIDHAVAMSLPILSGYIWETWGFRWVFLLAGAIALAGFFVCLRIRVPVRPLLPDKG
ncbi:MAG: MFS transporter [Candidatus Eisenbacteria bacterium]|uniref:MFS transporter n=1 Tax=Eiseniibacteriota bacterium TaxID=2212470 RepID=A0A948RU28_UNCEI|nr:MFS transporter [Candidatus Eisenbacteria bacterium]MBU1950754.1 MFS transporter [Candidatus Eisenbacteria bacterium]MBU2691025.1 MFS transporter [Candidatus Eisenbacteria bacterium]